MDDNLRQITHPSFVCESGLNYVYTSSFINTRLSATLHIPAVTCHLHMTEHPINNQAVCDPFPASNIVFSLPPPPPLQTLPPFSLTLSLLSLPHSLPLTPLTMFYNALGQESLPYLYRLRSGSLGAGLFNHPVY